MNKQVKIAFSIITLARILQIYWDSNYDWPDQYWQGPQIAFKLANGYGSQTWQWTMQHPIRNIIYQAYLSIGYFIGNVFNFQPINKERIIKLIQVFIAMLCDWFLLKIALVYTKRLTFITSILILSNWFYFAMMNRTYINSIETCLTVVAYYLWLNREKGKKYDLLSRIVVGLNFIIRTTSIIVWAVIWPLELVTMKTNRIKFIIKNVLQIFLMLLASVGFNSFWHQKLTFVQLNFLKYNIILKWSQLYGVSNFFYYFYLAIPLILGTYLLPLILSLATVLRNSTKQQVKFKKNIDDQKTKVQQIIENKKTKEVFIVLLIVLIILSCSAHKQPRFLLIITPFLMISCIKGFKKIQNKNFLLSVIIVVNLTFLFTMNYYGKNGGIKILRQIRQDIDQNYSDRLNNIAVIYLCEPHSLPSYSIIQKNIAIQLLDTSPLRKLQHFNQQIELKQNPQNIYNHLKQELKQKSIIYVIIQDRYSIFNGYLREEYRFLLRDGFTLLKTQRNANLLEQYMNGYDGFSLLKKS